MRPLLPVVAALLTAAACHSGEAAQASGWDLRSFEVPPSQRQQIVEVLASVLKGDRGRVQLGPDGRVVVLAPATTQDEIKREIIEPLLRQPPPAATVTMSYWMVLARPAHGSPPPPPPALAEIGPAVEEIQKTSGPAELQLLERFRLTGTPGEEVRSEGHAFDIAQRASVAGGRVVSDVRVNAQPETGSWNTPLSTRVNVAPGQLVVVGQTGLRSRLRGMPAQPPITGDETLLFVLRASIDDAHASK